MADESKPLKIAGVEIPQWLVTILASIITSVIGGYFVLQAATAPVRMEISATQTAEARSGATFVSNSTPSINSQGILLTPTQTVTEQLISPTPKTQSTPFNTPSVQITQTPELLKTSTFIVTKQVVVPTITAISEPAINYAVTPAPYPNTKSQANSINNRIPWFFEKSFLILVFWIVIALSNQSGREDLINKISQIMTDSRIIGYSKHVDVNQRTIYDPKDLLLMAAKIDDILIKPIKSSKDRVSNNIKSAVDFDPENYFKTIIKLMLFFSFLVADMIAIVNALAVASLSDVSSYPLFLSTLVSHYELSIIFGSIISLIVSAWVISDLASNKQRKTFFQRWVVPLPAYVLLTSSLSIMLFFTLARSLNFGMSSASYTSFVQQFDPIVVTLIVPFNCVLGSLLIHREALIGIMEINTLLASIFIIILDIILFLLRLLMIMQIFMTDILIKFIMCYLYIAAYLLISPLKMLVSISRKHSTKDPV